MKLSANFQPDHDLQLVVSLEEELRSNLVCQLGDKSAIGQQGGEGSGGGLLSMPCLMAQFQPDIPESLPKGHMRTEIVFVIDRSGGPG